MAGKDVHIMVSTNKGSYLLSSGNERQKWAVRGPFLEGEDVNGITNDSKGRLYASTFTNGVFISDDLGRTWTSSNKGLHVRKVWTVEPDPFNPGTVYAGTQYGLIFVSEDRGITWHEVTGLHNAPLRNQWGIDWGYGTTGLAIHTVKMDSKVPGKMYIVSSGAGPYLSNDRGETWSLLRSGVVDSCPNGARDFWSEKSSEQERVKSHLETVHTCTHKLALSTSKPGTLYQQNHCGVYVSSDSGGRWNDISISPEIRHGFAITLVENGDSSLFVIPAYQDRCKKHNSCILGPLEVYRFDDKEKSWENTSNGLPKDTHTGVLRDAMTHDFSEESNIYFGTTTGDVYAGTDHGNIWKKIATGLNRVQAVNAISSVPSGL